MLSKLCCPAVVLPCGMLREQMLQYEIARKQLLEKQQKKIEALEVRVVCGVMWCGRQEGPQTSTAMSGMVPNRLQTASGNKQLGRLRHF